MQGSCNFVPSFHPRLRVGALTFSHSACMQNRRGRKKRQTQHKLDVSRTADFFMAKQHRNFHGAAPQQRNGEKCCWGASKEAIRAPEITHTHTLRLVLARWQIYLDSACRFWRQPRASCIQCIRTHIFQSAMSACLSLANVCGDVCMLFCALSSTSCQHSASFWAWMDVSVCVCVCYADTPRHKCVPRMCHEIFALIFCQNISSLCGWVLDKRSVRVRCEMCVCGARVPELELHPLNTLTRSGVWVCCFVCVCLHV